MTIENRVRITLCRPFFEYALGMTGHMQLLIPEIRLWKDRNRPGTQCQSINRRGDS
jgi:hypothetical protein